MMQGEKLGREILFKYLLLIATGLQICWEIASDVAYSYRSLLDLLLVRFAQLRDRNTAIFSIVNIV